MRTTDDVIKRRLTTPAHILSALTMLEARGVSRDDLIVEMTKFFCVDLDEFERVLSRHQPAKRPAPPVSPLRLVKA
jgi:hypothetical protein